MWEMQCYKFLLSNNIEFECQYKIDLKVCKFIVDFKCIVNGKELLIDAKASKSLLTPVYKLKKKYLKYFHDLDVIEVYKLGDLREVFDN